MASRRYDKSPSANTEMKVEPMGSPFNSKSSHREKAFWHLQHTAEVLSLEVDLKLPAGQATQSTAPSSMCCSTDLTSRLKLLVHLLRLAAIALRIYKLSRRISVESS